VLMLMEVFGGAGPAVAHPMMDGSLESQSKFPPATGAPPYAPGTLAARQPA